MKHSSTSLKSNNKIKILYTVAALLLFAAAAFGLMCGSTHITLSHIINGIKNGSVGSQESILLYIRLPRTLACIMAGAALSVSGAIIQNVLANRLASTGIIGINSGAGLGVTLCTVFGLYSGWWISASAFVGAFVAVLIISLGARKFNASRGTVILMGVAMNSIFNAFSDSIITFNPDIAVMSTDFKIGDFSAVSYQKLVPAIIIVISALIILFTLTNELDVLTMGEDIAHSLGLNVKVIRSVFLIICALLAGCAVSIAGLLSFVGLIIPHIVRRMGALGSKHLLILSALFGASFVTICDTVARTVFSPYEIPVGIIMAFIGAPFFIFILIKSKGGHSNA